MYIYCQELWRTWFLKEPPEDMAASVTSVAAAASWHRSDPGKVLCSTRRSPSSWDNIIIITLNVRTALSLHQHGRNLHNHQFTAAQTRTDLTPTLTLPPEPEETWGCRMKGFDTIRRLDIICSQGRLSRLSFNCPREKRHKCQKMSLLIETNLHK